MFDSLVLRDCKVKKYSLFNAMKIAQNTRFPAYEPSDDC